MFRQVRSASRRACNFVTRVNRVNCNNRRGGRRHTCTSSTLTRPTISRRTVVSTQVSRVPAFYIFGRALRRRQINSKRPRNRSKAIRRPFPRTGFVNANRFRNHCSRRSQSRRDKGTRTSICPRINRVNANDSNVILRSFHRSLFSGTRIFVSRGGRENRKR